MRTYPANINIACPVHHAIAGNVKRRRRKNCTPRHLHKTGILPPKSKLGNFSDMSPYIFSNSKAFLMAPLSTGGHGAHSEDALLGPAKTSFSERSRMPCCGVQQTGRCRDIAIKGAPDLSTADTPPGPFLRC